MDTPQFLTYAQAAEQYPVSVRQLRNQVATGRLTRHSSSRDLRVTLLDTRELESIYGEGALNRPAA